MVNVYRAAGVIEGDQSVGFPYYGNFPHNRLGRGKYEVVMPLGATIYAVGGGRVTNVRENGLTISYSNGGTGVYEGVTATVRVGDAALRGTKIGVSSSPSVVIESTGLQFLDKTAPFSGRSPASISAAATAATVLNTDTVLLRPIGSDRLRFSGIPGETRRTHVHRGIDFVYDTAGAIRDARVFAVENGVITRALPEAQSGGYGNTVTLKGDAHYKYLYGHLHRYVVKEGQRVKAGDLIGYVGDSGAHGANHLHFEVGERNGPDGNLKDSVRLTNWFVRTYYPGLKGQATGVAFEKADPNDGKKRRIW